MSRQSNRDLAKRYLLGTLSEEERDRLEQQYFSDTAEFEEIEITEDDLVDQYVRGELSSADRSLFQKVLSGSPQLSERVEFAQILRDKTSAVAALPVREPETISKTGGWRRFFWPEKPTGLAVAFAVLLVLVGGLGVVSAWLRLRQQSASMVEREAALRQQSEELARQRTELQANNEQQARRLREREAQLEVERQAIQKQIEESGRPAAVLPALLLWPGTVRGGGELRETTLDRTSTAIIVQLALLDTDYARYRAVVLNPDEQRMFGPRTLIPKRTRSGSILSFSLPTKDIEPGDYFVRVEGITPSGESQRVGDYPFRLKPPK